MYSLRDCNGRCWKLVAVAWRKECGRMGGFGIVVGVVVIDLCNTAAKRRPIHSLRRPPATATATQGEFRSASIWFCPFLHLFVFPPVRNWSEFLGAPAYQQTASNWLLKLTLWGNLGGRQRRCILQGDIDDENRFGKSTIIVFTTIVSITFKIPTVIIIIATAATVMVSTIHIIIIIIIGRSTITVSVMVPSSLLI
ncbi:hypothetical protein LOK49_Contig256G00003 [Camellia lanceoleosa]|nr:hypothetical protein LOK49_Contig256G00003 [Camellia lanceoleosa]